MQWYVGDWLKDPALGQCSPATRGIWMDMLCLMHENDESGELHGTAESLARICRCTAKEMRAAIEDLRVTNGADVTLGHEKITIVCRRMSRAYKVRVRARNRKRKERGDDGGHSDGTPNVEETSRLLSSSSSSSSSFTDVKDQSFDAAWKRYPKRAGGNPKASALKAWQARITAGADPSDLLAGVERYAAFCQATDRIGTEYVKQAATFFGPDEHYAEDWTLPRSTENGNGRYETTHERFTRLNRVDGDDPFAGPLEREASGGDDPAVETHERDLRR